MAALLVALMLALPLSHAAAEQRQQYLPLSPYSQQEQDAGGAPATAQMARWRRPLPSWSGVLLAWVASAEISRQGAQGSPSTQDPPRWLRQEERQQKPEAPRPDTSIGCAWGDRAYGTCH